MGELENKIQCETRAFNSDGELISNSYILLNENTGKYEFRDLKEHLRKLGLLDEKTIELNKRVDILRNQINHRLNAINKIQTN